MVWSLSVPKTPTIGSAITDESEHDYWMFTIAFLFVRVLCDCFELRRRVEAEILVLRHQLNVLQRRTPRRLYLTWADRALFVWLYRCFPRILDVITNLRPETIVRWHRKGFAAFWRGNLDLFLIRRLAKPSRSPPKKPAPTARPSNSLRTIAFAVLVLMSSWNFIRLLIGRSFGFSPLRMLSKAFAWQANLACHAANNS